MAGPAVIETNGRGFVTGLRNQDAAARSLGLSQIIGGSTVPQTVTGTTAETVLGSVVIPGGMAAAGSLLRLHCLWSHTNSANIKTMKARLGGGAGFDLLNGRQVVGAAATLATRLLWFRGAAQQIAWNNWADLGSVSNASIVSNVNCAVDQVFDFTGTLALAGESLTLEAWTLEIVGA